MRRSTIARRTFQSGYSVAKPLQTILNLTGPCIDAWRIFDNDPYGPLGPHKSLIVPPESRVFAIQSLAVSADCGGEAGLLAGESSGNNVNWSDLLTCQAPNVVIDGHPWPVLRKHLLAVRVNLAKAHGVPADVPCRQREPANAAK
jgi:hypothetical protein